MAHLQQLLQKYTKECVCLLNGGLLSYFTAFTKW